MRLRFAIESWPTKYVTVSSSMSVSAQTMTTLDVVDAKVPRGLYNAELSLVVVPGMPETTIHVLEHLQTFGNGEDFLEEKDLEI